MSSIIAYTDGASTGNPGPGGYGVVLISPAHNNHRLELSDGFRRTTNNRMELLAAIMALEVLKFPGQHITIHSDSAYVVNAVEKKWVWNWRKKGYDGKKNADLWERFIKAYQKHHVKMVWVKGHAGIPENERCDELATTAAKQADLKIDHGYEKGN
ncbi:ribonuclease HI [Algivirga pacifica]|uniref:ribonuclease H n=1 Tax=Algivirga pacifica TaxID=1162670 RepID=A0ABP9DKJ6_9BACT